jgi:uncharacterized protein (TIGR03435 family)
MELRKLFVLVAASAAMSQSQTPVPRPQFEVASVKPHTGVERAVMLGFPSPGRFQAQNVWLRFLIQNAWNVKDYQVVSGPGWAPSDRYDIDAKTDPSTSREQMRLMVQALLQDRFQLVLHHESRSLPVYHLAASKDGSKLSPSKEGSCIERDSVPAAKPGLPTSNFCGGVQWSQQSLSGTAITMQQFTTMLENILQRPVIDETGFTAKFDVHLTWIPDQVTPGLLAPGVSPPPLPSPNDSGGPTIFNVLAEHLGLKLRAEKGPVDILVIDRAEKPSAN